MQIQQFLYASLFTSPPSPEQQLCGGRCQSGTNVMRNSTPTTPAGRGKPQTHIRARADEHEEAEVAVEISHH